MFQKITIVGNLGTDPEGGETRTGSERSRFRVAVNDRPDHTEWFSVNAYGRDATFANQFLKKGRLVAISGRLQTREYNGKYYTDLHADSVKGLDRLGGDRQEGGYGGAPQGRGGSQDRRRSERPRQERRQAPQNHFNDDDIPF